MINEGHLKNTIAKHSGDLKLLIDLLYDAECPLSQYRSPNGNCIEMDAY